MEIDFTYSPGPNVVWMSAVVYRASDGVVVWSDAYRSDATMTALLRTGKVIPTRAERAAELEAKINAAPELRHTLGLGVAQIGYTRRHGRHHRARTMSSQASREVRREPRPSVRPAAWASS